MNKIRKLLGCAVLAFMFNASHAGPISDVADSFLSKSPEAVFEEAISKNDYRLLSIPSCGHINPGFNFRDYRGEELQGKNDFGLTCKALLGEEECKALKRLEPWVTRYNKLIYDALHKGD